MSREPYATLAGGSFAAAAADKPGFVGQIDVATALS